MRVPIILLCGNAGAGKSTVAEMLGNRTGFKVVGQADAIKELVRAPFGLSQEQLYGPSECRNAVVEHLNTKAWQEKLEWASTWMSTGTYDGIDLFMLDMMGLERQMLNMSGSNQEWKLKNLLSAFLHGCAQCAEAGSLTTRHILQQLGTEVGRTFDKLMWTRATFEAAQRAIEEDARGVIVADGRFRSEIYMASEYRAMTVLIDGMSASQATHSSEAELATIPDHFFDAVIKNNKHHGLRALEYAIDDFVSCYFEPTIFRTYE